VLVTVYDSAILKEMELIPLLHAEEIKKGFSGSRKSEMFFEAFSAICCYCSIEASIAEQRLQDIDNTIGSEGMAENRRIVFLKEPRRRGVGWAMKKYRSSGCKIGDQLRGEAKARLGLENRVKPIGTVENIGL